VKSVALAAGGTRTYCYDANGNLTGDNAGLSLKYDHQNLPVVAQRGALRDDFRYGPDGQCTRSWGSDGNRVYLPGYEHRTDTGETKVYIGDYAVISKTGATRKVEYLLKDRLGSVDAVVNASGSVIETRGYDAFGKPRNGTWNDLSPAKIASTAVTPKGFTQHEHLNQLELIHMNGRAYDYNLGRFTGVDPFIQFPLNSQSLNPYSYILNNPLSGTDPTGYASCTTDASAGECAAAAGSGGTAKVTSQAEGSRIKQTVGTVKNNGDGSATVTNTSNGNAVRVTGLANGGAKGQGTLGTSSRQNQTASASEKNATTNTSVTNTSGSESSSAAPNPEIRGRVGADGPVLPEVGKLAADEGEQAVAGIRKKRYRNMDKLASDVADALQPITDHWHTEVGARIFKNGRYYELGSVVSSGDICLRGGGCSVPMDLSRNLNGVLERVVGYIHMHPENVTFSKNDLNFAWTDRRLSISMTEQTAYVSWPDRSLHSFNTTMVGKVPGASDWNDYLPYVKKIR
jgi:RHS repeat-associated protein